MQSLMMVALKIVVQSLRYLPHGLEIMKKNTRRLHGTPEALNQAIVQRTASSIHADLNATVQQELGESVYGEFGRLDLC